MRSQSLDLFDFSVRFCWHGFKKVGMRLLSEAFYIFFTEVPSQSLHTESFIKHQNVNKHSFFVGLWHPIIIAGHKTKNPRFYCFVLIVKFYTKVITYNFITLGSTCDYGDCDLFKIDKKKFHLRYCEKKLTLRERKLSFLSEDLLFCLHFFMISNLCAHNIHRESKQ